MIGTGNFRSARSSALGAAVLLALASDPSIVMAQRVDSAQVGARRTPRDSARAPLPKPPLSPRRAFLFSLVVPGYSQSVLGRPTAGAIFVLTEGIALAMLHESAADLRQARRLKTDSLIVIGVDPATGADITQTSGYTQELIDVRRGHVEDWLAFLIANHLFAAADAYVAAHLWDLPTQVSVESRPTGAVVAARLRW
ncbi:MAG TPA: hypothetical protein VFP90_06425 [Gemmatimonadaceae bacterium]|jgi:hypothetical protein|nr:hypothetical protein [Gemmatimonadaceae bacterium]